MGSYAKPMERARITIFLFRRRRKEVMRCFTMYFQTYFFFPHVLHLRYWKLSQRLHVLLLWWSGTVVTALRPLKSGVWEYISPRINFCLYLPDQPPQKYKPISSEDSIFSCGMQPLSQCSQLQRVCMWHHQQAISAYFCILPCMCHHLERQWIGKLYGEAYSTSSLRGTEHAFSFNFILCRELVMTVNIPELDRNATCRINASTGSSTH